MVAFDPLKGKEIWSCRGLNPLVYTSPIYENGIIVAMGGYRGTAMGVRAGGVGDVTATHQLWTRPGKNSGWLRCFSGWACLHFE